MSEVTKEQCFHEDILPISPDVVEAVYKARKLMEKIFVSQEEMENAFLR